MIETHSEQCEWRALGHRTDPEVMKSVLELARESLKFRSSWTWMPGVKQSAKGLGATTDMYGTGRIDWRDEERRSNEDGGYRFRRYCYAET